MSAKFAYLIAIDVPEGEAALDLFAFFESGGIGPSNLCEGELAPSGIPDRVQVAIAGESGSVGLLINRDDQAIPITITASGGGPGPFDSADIGLGPISKLYVNTDPDAPFGSYGAATLLVTMLDR